ncbi:hypothetical protein EXIGLDRAFT_722311 [Exidia glandulosa HHB12029]|uniref:Uncharacterized protein n=1 Tax=Exidia glandulosa HHB12029 TaxID=1314781 RepID=A0A166BE43_EXIGL|nr:hypothetical protein EXIGLDRAFT_722311 [Exidia glandulosa HHB12029]
MTDRRALYVLRYPVHLFAAHMALFIPHADSEQDDLGKVLHATGDQRSGFVREFKRNYSALDTARRPTRHVIGTIDAVFVLDVVGDGELLIETDPAEADAQDEIERVALSVAAPGPSLRECRGRSRGSSDSEDICSCG